MKISTYDPYFNNHRHLLRIDRFKRPIETYERLKNEGYIPYDVGPMLVTMQKIQFTKLIKNHGDAAAIKQVGNTRLSCVWDENGVEISCVEDKPLTWQIVNNWSTL